MNKTEKAMAKRLVYIMSRIPVLDEWDASQVRAFNWLFQDGAPFPKTLLLTQVDSFLVKEFSLNYAIGESFIVHSRRNAGYAAICLLVYIALRLRALPAYLRYCRDNNYVSWRFENMHSWLIQCHQGHRSLPKIKKQSLQQLLETLAYIKRNVVLMAENYQFHGVSEGHMVVSSPNKYMLDVIRCLLSKAGPVMPRFWWEYPSTLIVSFDNMSRHLTFYVEQVGVTHWIYTSEEEKVEGDFENVGTLEMELQLNSPLGRAFKTIQNFVPIRMDDYVLSEN